MKGSVYLYLGHTQLTHGSFEDLRKLGIVPQEGMTLDFYDLDADERDRPTYLCAKGTLYRDSYGNWHAEIDQNSFSSILRSDVDVLTADTIMNFFVATSNPGKLRDFAATASPQITLTPLPGLKQIQAPAEDEPTFEGNARIKAIYYSHHAPNEIVIADDSGLEVDALHGAPGVRSARYADDHHFTEPANATTDERNNLYLLTNLTDIPLTERSARYHCVLAAARDGKILAIGHGAVEGEILSAPRGSDGFGYDPLFYLPAQNKTMAELDIATKLTFSHRGRAFAALISELNSGLHSHSSR